MRIDLIPVGKNPPEDLNVIIEVPTGGEPVKYEFDKESGALFVDRILHTPMRYPANYGFVPHTLSPDGDPLDALVISRSPFIPGCVVRARPIGVLKLEDEHGGDESIAAFLRSGDGAREAAQVRQMRRDCCRQTHDDHLPQMMSVHKMQAGRNASPDGINVDFPKKFRAAGTNFR